MALRTPTRFISKVFQSRGNTGVLLNSIRRNETDASDAAPYRPFPFDFYFWPRSSEVWLPRYPAQSEKADQFPREEIYIDELEERLRKYDRKYSHTQEVKDLYNQFGWEDQDDRAYHYYPFGVTSPGEEASHGRGKKIDPAHYITPEVTWIPRQRIPPIQYLTAEQIRRSRGSLANFREMPAETPSIWKFWNAYSTFGVFAFLLLSKEYFVTQGHDFYEAIVTFMCFGAMGAVVADWIAWMHTCMAQEQHDREYLPLLEHVQQFHQMLENLNNRPNEKKLLMKMAHYREELSEKVLKKTLHNKLGRIAEATYNKLESKISEDNMIRRETENTWKKDALEQSIAYFSQESVKDDFMKRALDEFTSSDGAQLTKEAKTLTLDTNEFVSQYKSNYENVKSNYIKTQDANNTLHWVFKDSNTKQKETKSTEEKLEEYKSRVSQWQQSHNSVPQNIPAFS